MQLDRTPDRPVGLPSIFIKVIISLCTGGLAYLITSTVSDQEWSLVITLSVLLSSVTLVVQFLVDFDRRLEDVSAQLADRQAELAATVTERFGQISEATELFAMVDRSSLRTDAITDLVRNATRIGAEPPLAHHLAQVEIRRTSDFLRQLHGRTVTHSGEDREWVLALTRGAQRSIDATSLTSVDGGFWTSDLGQRYLLDQHESAKRGVRIRRVFILHSGDLAKDPDLARTCQQQLGRGIEVRVLEPVAFPAVLRHLVVDFIVFDGVLSYETTPSAALVHGAEPTIENTRLHVDSAHVEARKRAFEELWAAATGVGADRAAAASAGD
jgi:hypothetical protein